jgi:hypothetical protein
VRYRIRQRADRVACRDLREDLRRGAVTVPSKSQATARRYMSQRGARTVPAQDLCDSRRTASVHSQEREIEQRRSHGREPGAGQRRGASAVFRGLPIAEVSQEVTA